MAWHRLGDKPLSEAMIVRLSTHICFTRPQWVKCTATTFVGTLMTKFESMGLWPSLDPVYSWNDDQVWFLFIYGMMTKFGSCLYMGWWPSLGHVYIWNDEQVWILFIYGMMTKFGSCLYMGWWPRLDPVYIWDDELVWVMFIYGMMTKFGSCLYMGWWPSLDPVYSWNDDQVWVLFIYGMMTKFGSCLYMGWWPSLDPVYIWDDDQVWTLFIHGMMTKIGFCLYMGWWPSLGPFYLSHAWAVVSKAVDSTGPNFHIAIIGCNTLICISVAQGMHMLMAFMPYLVTLDLLLMLNVNGMQHSYISINHPLLYWLNKAFCSK